AAILMHSVFKRKTVCKRLRHLGTINQFSLCFSIAHALVRPRTAKRVSNNAISCYRTGNSHCCHQRDCRQTLCKRTTNLTRRFAAFNCKINACLEFFGSFHSLCTPVQHFLHLAFHLHLIHVSQPPLAFPLFRSTPAADGGGRKT